MYTVFRVPHFDGREAEMTSSPRSTILPISSIGTMAIVYIASLLALCLGTYVLRSNLAQLFTPKGIPGFPTLPNAKPIVGDLFSVIDGIKRLGGMGNFADEIALKLGPQFQIRIFHKV